MTTMTTTTHATAGPRGRTTLVAIGAAVAGAAVVAGLALGFGGASSASSVLPTAPAVSTSGAGHHVDSNPATPRFGTY